MTHAEFVALVRRNPVNAALLDRIPQLHLPDAWLVSGSLFQTVWNLQTGRPATHGIKDYDIFYFDADTSYDAEDAQIRKVAALCADLDADIEVRNQARVHLWYKDHFKVDYTPLASACEGIDRFLAIACKLGVSLDGKERVYAPDGLADMEQMRIRPNPSNNFSAEHYATKSGRWHDKWPELTVEAAG